MRTVGLIDNTPQEAPAVFVCPHCGKEYKTEEDLAKHMTKEHAEE